MLIGTTYGVRIFAKNNYNIYFSLVNCPDLKEVELGTTRCTFTYWLQEVSWTSWDDGQNCLPFCLRKMNEESWEKGCCEAVQFNCSGCSGGFGTICKIHDVGEVAEPGNDTSKAVQCQGTLNSGFLKFENE